MFDPEKAILSIEATAQTFLKSQTHKTVQDVFSKPSATLATVKKYGGETKMLAVVESMMKSVVAFLNVGRGMAENQISETAKMIFDEYYYLTIGDFKVCFRNGMQGKYGQLYDRLDGMIIFSWLEQYDNERIAFVESTAAKELIANQKKETATNMPQWLSEKLREMQVRKINVFQGSKPGQKFSTLTDFLKSIERSDEESRNEIISNWENEYLQKSPELELDAFLIYKSNQLLCAVNLGKITSWEDVLESLKVPENEIPDFSTIKNN